MQMSIIFTFFCQSCHMAGLNIRLSSSCASVCTMCQAFYLHKENMIKDLPIWYDKKRYVHYNYPDVLKFWQENAKFLKSAICYLCTLTLFTKWPNKI